MHLNQNRGGYQIRSDRIYFLTLTVVQWCNIFSDQRFIDIVLESLRLLQKQKGLNLYAFVIMPNHLHLIAESPNRHLGHVIGDFKHFTANRMIAALKENFEDKKFLKIFQKFGMNNPRNKKYQVWIQDNHPIELNTNFMLDQKLEYIHMNPVKAGLVSRPEDFKYSSAIDYYGGKGVLNIIHIE